MSLGKYVHVWQHVFQSWIIRIHSFRSYRSWVEIPFWKEGIVEGLYRSLLQLPKTDWASHLCDAANEESLTAYAYKSTQGMGRETQECLLKDFI